MTGESEPTTVGRALDRAAGLYSRFAELRAVTKSIPIIGRTLDTVLGERVDVIKGERFLEWIELLRDIVRELDEQKVDHAFLDSDEFLALFTRTAKEAADCWEREKLATLAQFLANSATTPSGPGYRERTLAIIASLCVGHLTILRYAAEHTKPPEFSYLHSDEPYFPTGASPLIVPTDLIAKIAPNEQVGLVQDLASRGLLLKAGSFPAGDRQFAPGYVITEQGLEVIAMIRESGSGKGAP